MTTRKMFVQSLTIVALTLAIALPAAQAQSSISSRTQLRRTVEDSTRTAYGDVRMTNKSGRETLAAKIRELSQQSFRIYVTTNDSTSFQTNNFVFFVAALEQKNAKKGDWQRSLVGEGGSPDALAYLYENIQDLAGHQIVIARPGPDQLVALTNILNCVTNIDILAATTNVVCETNILVGAPLFDPGTTGTVSAVLWAPVFPFLAKPSDASYTQRADLLLPDGVPPSPDASGELSIRFNNAAGQSVFSVRARGLISGQVYSVWIGDSSSPSILVKAGDMTVNKGNASFVRDTRYGDPLPQQVGFPWDLAGRPLAILDEFETPHLVLIIPPPPGGE